jgi:hypothetical protein
VNNRRAFITLLGCRSRRARISPAPSRTRRKIRYHSSTIRDHIEAPKRGPEHVITNSKNRFH